MHQSRLAFRQHTLGKADGKAARAGVDAAFSRPSTGRQNREQFLTPCPYAGANVTARSKKWVEDANTRLREIAAVAGHDRQIVNKSGGGD